MPPPEFRDQALREILAYVEAERARGAPRIGLRVLDPDRGRGCHAGERIEVDGVRYVHRPWRVWVDLADRLALRLATPRPCGALVELWLEPLDRARDLHAPAAAADPLPRLGVMADVGVPDGGTAEKISFQFAVT